MSLQLALEVVAKEPAATKDGAGGAEKALLSSLSTLSKELSDDLVQQRHCLMATLGPEQCLLLPPGWICFERTGVV